MLNNTITIPQTFKVTHEQFQQIAAVNRDLRLERKTMLVRGMRLEGSIIRLNMTLPADKGEDLTVDATAFIPDVEEYWGDFPCFIGQRGFLERVRYAVDPATDTFYFGTL